MTSSLRVLQAEGDPPSGFREPRCAEKTVPSSSVVSHTAGVYSSKFKCFCEFWRTEKCETAEAFPEWRRFRRDRTNATTAVLSRLWLIHDNKQQLGVHAASNAFFRNSDGIICSVRMMKLLFNLRNSVRDSSERS